MREFIQQDCTSEKLSKGLDVLLHDETRRKTLQEDYETLRSVLSSGGHASDNAAAIITKIAIASSKKQAE